MEKGYIIIARKIRESRSYTRGVEYGGLMLELLLRANHSEKFVYGIKCQRGQCIVSVVKLSETLKLSRSKTNRMLKHLENDKFLILKADSQKTVISICNYDIYQDVKLYKRTTNGQQTDIKRTTNEHQTDTNKECKELNIYIFGARENKFIEKNFDEKVVEALQDYCNSYFENHHQKLNDSMMYSLLKQLRDIPEADRHESIQSSIRKKYREFYPPSLQFKANQKKKGKIRQWR